MTEIYYQPKKIYVGFGMKEWTFIHMHTPVYAHTLTHTITHVHTPASACTSTHGHARTHTRKEAEHYRWWSEYPLQRLFTRHMSCLRLNYKDYRVFIFVFCFQSVVPVSRPVVSTASAVPGKNPVSLLNEYAQKISKRLSFESTQSGLSHKPV